MRSNFDVFISYSPADDIPFHGSETGWISTFQRFLKLILDPILDTSITIYPFHQNNTISKHSEEYQAIICICSPQYISNSACLKELETLNQDQEKGNKIFKVNKYPIAGLDEPTFLKSIPGYDMYFCNPETGNCSEIKDFFCEEAENFFWMKLIDLAYDIVDVLGANQKSNLEITKPIKSNVYLAEVGYDLVNERDYIKRELQKHGYKVLPGKKLPTNIQDLEKEILQNLKASDFSIHMFGDIHGTLVDGTLISLPELENKMAAEWSHTIHTEYKFVDAKSDSCRVIWISPELKKTNEKQNKLIENILKDSELQAGAEILQSSIEDLKFLIRKELLTRPISKKLQDYSPKKNKLYLLYDSIDAEQSRLMIDYLSSYGFDVLTPEFQGDLMDLRQRHIENLRICDGAIIHYGKVNEQWVKIKLFDLIKAPGFGRETPIVAKAIYNSGGSKINDAYYNNFDVDILENESSRIADSIKPFLAKLDKKMYE